MLRTFVLAAALFVLSFPVSGAAEKAAAPKAAGTDICACGNYTLVPLYRAYNSKRLDHFYTTSFDELLGAERDGWAREADAGLVLGPGSSAPGAIPLYRFWNNARSDHFYTTSTVERDQYTFASGWVYQGIAAYVLPGPACGTLPFYRMYSNSWSDHFYNTSPAKLVNAVTNLGFVFESVSGYIWPADTSDG